MDIDDLGRRRRVLQGEFDAKMAGFSSGPEWMSKYRALSENLLGAERELSKAKGEEYAVPCEMGVRWDPGAPLPHLLSSGQRAYLTFLIDEPDPDWDGTYVNVKSPSSGVVESLALVEFEGATVKFGEPNDEVMGGHPLRGNGLMPYGAHDVLNSRWIQELQEINKVHPRYDPAHWTDLKHYLFAFHDETFECLASGHRVEVQKTCLKDLVRSVAEKMMPR